MLSKMGYNVLVLERASAIGAFTENKIDVTESELPDGSELGSILKELQIKPFKQINVSKWSSRNESFILKTDVRDFYFKRGPSKDSLDYQLIKKAEKNGCEFFQNVEIKKFKFEKDKICQVFLNKNARKIIVKPKVIIGADGSFSICRKLAGIREIKSSNLEGFGIRFKNKKFQGTEVFFDSEFVPGGYIYSANVKDEGIVGILIDKQMTNKSSRAIFEINKKKNINFKKYGEVELLNYFQGSEKYGMLETIQKGNLLLVGGAGLLIDPFMGYGLNYALLSSYKASNVVNHYLSGHESLEKYGDFYNKYLSSTFKDGDKARNIFRKLNNKDLDFIIRSLKNITKTNAKNFKALIEILKAKPTSMNALRTLFIFSKNLY